MNNLQNMKKLLETVQYHDVSDAMNTPNLVSYVDNDSGRTITFRNEEDARIWLDAATHNDADVTRTENHNDRGMVVPNQAVSALESMHDHYADGEDSGPDGSFMSQFDRKLHEFEEEYMFGGNYNEDLGGNWTLDKVRQEFPKAPGLPGQRDFKSGVTGPIPIDLWQNEILPQIRKEMIAQGLRVWYRGPRGNNTSRAKSATLKADATHVVIYRRT